MTVVSDAKLLMRVQTAIILILSLPWSGELVLGRVAIENGRVQSSIGRLDRVNRLSSVRVDRDAVGNRSSRSRGDRVQVG